jgi:cobalt-zinc-cadmium efflux system protein
MAGSNTRGFALGVALNSAFVVAELIAGTLADSVALLADAAHNLGDVVGLLLAWGAALLAGRAPTRTRTYGWRKSTILAALANALLLIAATGALAWEAIGRLADPPAAAAPTMIVVAAIGVVINALAAWILLRSGHGHAHHGHDHHGHDHDHHGHDHAPRDLNRRAAFVHMLADAGVSLGVVLTGALMLATGWAWLDPALSLVIALVIVIGTWSLLRESLALTLDAVPATIELDAVREYLRARPCVVGVHDLHVWALGSSEIALTAHLVLDQPPPSSLLAELETGLHERFGIDHTTLQVESPQQAPCRHPAGCAS